MNWIPLTSFWKNFPYLTSRLEFWTFILIKLRNTDLLDCHYSAFMFIRRGRFKIVLRKGFQLLISIIIVSSIEAKEDLVFGWLDIGATKGKNWAYFWRTTKKEEHLGSKLSHGWTCFPMSPCPGRLYCLNSCQQNLKQ